MFRQKIIALISNKKLIAILLCAVFITAFSGVYALPANSGSFGDISSGGPGGHCGPGGPGGHDGPGCHPCPDKHVSGGGDHDPILAPEPELPVEEPITEIIKEEPVIEQRVETPVIVAEPAKVVRSWIIHFDFDKYNLRAQDISILNDVVNYYRWDPGSAFVLVGHTDSFGTDLYNDNLSMRRVKAAQRYLIDHGVPAAAISIDAKGESMPVMPNNSSESRAQNRRVTIELR